MSQNIQYVYSATQNNGRIIQSIDAVSGEQVTYQYDTLNRLLHAETAGNTWGETYQYDGFGNLTAKTPTKGSAPAWSATYNAATNWQMGVQYDANGNPPVGTFDVENRLVSEIDPSTGDTVSWLYDPWGKRVGRQDQTTGASQYTLYGVTGQRLAVLACTSNGQWSTCATANSNVYFKGRLLMRAARGLHVGGPAGVGGDGQRVFSVRGGERESADADGDRAVRDVLPGLRGAGLRGPAVLQQHRGQVPDAGPGRDSDGGPEEPGELEPICVCEWRSGEPQRSHGAGLA